MELSRQSKQIYQTVAEIWEVWSALKKKKPDRDHLHFMRQKYSKFIVSKLGTQLFYQVKWFIDNNQQYDLNKLQIMLRYRDRINQGTISNEDASAHFEYAMHKEHAYQNYTDEYKIKMDREYEKRFKNKSADVKRNDFLSEKVDPPLTVKVQINDSDEE